MTPLSSFVVVVAIRFRVGAKANYKTRSRVVYTNISLSFFELHNCLADGLVDGWIVSDTVAHIQEKTKANGSYHVAALWNRVALLHQCKRNGCESSCMQD